MFVWILWVPKTFSKLVTPRTPIINIGQEAIAPRSSREVLKIRMSFLKGALKSSGAA